MHFWTETPIKEIWNQLRYLASPANVHNLLSGRTQSNRAQSWPENEELQTRSAAIAACVHQADEYSRAADVVNLATEPLLLFYAAQSLAKAAILATSPGVQLNDLRYHGLSSRASTAPAALADELKSYSLDSTTWEVEREFAVTNDGVFPHLCNAVGNPLPSPRSVLRFKELIRILPDLAPLYRRHYGEPSHCYYLYTSPSITADSRFEIFFQEIDWQEVEKLFPELAEEYSRAAHPHGPSFKGFRSTSAVASIPSWVHEQPGTVAGQYLVRAHDSGIYATTAVLYAGLFILSNVVRYKAAFWMGVLEGRAAGSAAIVESFCNMAKRRFPNDTLEIIWNERFSYGTAAYFA